MNKHEHDLFATMPPELVRGLQDLGPVVPTDARFWQDFARDVRDKVHAAASARQRHRWWLGASMTVAIAAAATLLLVWNHGRTPAPLSVGARPAVPGETWTDFLGRGNVEELDDDAVEVFLDDTDPSEGVPADDDRFATDTAERKLDELSNPEIERVLGALNKGA